MGTLAAQSCKYNEKRDIQEVESGLTVDLNQALKSGIVRDSGSSTDSNGIEDPGLIIGRVENVFDAIEAQRSIRKYGKKAKPAMTPSSPSPAAESANPTGAPSA